MTITQRRGQASPHVPAEPDTEREVHAHETHHIPTREDDIWGFHGKVINRTHQNSMRYGEQRKSRFVGNEFGNQPPRENRT